MRKLPTDLSPEQKLLAAICLDHCDGNRSEMARRIGKDASYVARLFYPAGKAGAKGIGIEIMAACTREFHLPPGFWEGAGTKRSGALASKGGGTAGLSTLQVATVDALTSALRGGRVDDKACLRLIAEWLPQNPSA
jgi:hypothetical protein